MCSKPTLNDWMDAHRALLQEETTLLSMAAEVATHQADAAALHAQQSLLMRTREHADSVYAQVMQSLRDPQ